MLECSPRGPLVTREVDIGNLRNPDSIDRLGKSRNWDIVPADQNAIGFQAERICPQGGAEGSGTNEKTPSADLH
jgi:hypothetical protein